MLRNGQFKKPKKSLSGKQMKSLSVRLNLKLKLLSRNKKRLIVNKKHRQKETPGEREEMKFTKKNQISRGKEQMSKMINNWLLLM